MSVIRSEHIQRPRSVTNRDIKPLSDTTEMTRPWTSPSTAYFAHTHLSVHPPKPSLVLASTSLCTHPESFITTPRTNNRPDGDGKEDRFSGVYILCAGLFHVCGRGGGCVVCVCTSMYGVCRVLFFCAVHMITTVSCCDGLFSLVSRHSSSGSSGSSGTQFSRHHTSKN